MRKIIILFALAIFTCSQSFASDLTVGENSQITKLMILPELHNCYTAWIQDGHLIELVVVYEGWRCNTDSQAAGIYIDGEFVYADNCTDFAVNVACGPANCI